MKFSSISSNDPNGSSLGKQNLNIFCDHDPGKKREEKIANNRLSSSNLKQSCFFPIPENFPGKYRKRPHY